MRFPRRVCTSRIAPTSTTTNRRRMRCAILALSIRSTDGRIPAASHAFGGARAHRHLSRSSCKVTSGTTLRDLQHSRMNQSIDPGVVLLSVEGIGNGSGAKRRPNSNLRWRGSASVARFDKAESVGLPPRRLLAVDIGGLGTYRRYGMVLGTGTYRYW